MSISMAACGSDTNSNAEVGDNGKVYYLNFKPKAADQWKDLAQAYTDETGVEVTVETAASNTYEQQLKSEMAKSNAPTLFQVNGPVGSANWKDYTADMSDTEVYTSSCRTRMSHSRTATRSSACRTSWRPTA